MKFRKTLAVAIGRELRNLRKEKGISLKEFEANDDSIDRHSLSRIETAEKIPSIETLFKICLVLKIGVSEFFLRVEKSLKR